jgi:predicted nucleic acid-binding protein
MSGSHFIDTNILLYSISSSPDERRKNQIAIDLLDRDGGALSVQVLQEFYVQATRATRTDRLSHDDATAFIDCWMRFAVQDNNVAVMRHALAIKTAHQLSYWDSAIIAAACAQGCREVWSEDMAHGWQMDGVRIVNPFV